MSKDLDDAKDSFISIIKSLPIGKQRTEFIDWVTSYLGDSTLNNGGVPCKVRSCCARSCCKPPGVDKKADVLLSCIKTMLKEKLPFNAILTDESISYPTVGDDVHLNSENCVHVDAFLYDEEDVDQLIDEGKLHNSYCKDCKSKNIDEITFITHSASKKCLEYIFQHAIPNLQDQIVVDIGSRLGVVLYAAHAYSKAKEIIGIEINKNLCDLQNEVISKFKLGDRCKILHNDVRDVAGIIKKADVIVLNNVFEWFLPLQEQEDVWKYLHKNCKPGCTIVAAPPIETSLDLLETGIVIDKWVKELTLENLKNLEFTEEMNLKVYVVLPKK